MVLGWPLCLEGAAFTAASSNNQRLHTPHAGKLHAYVAHVARQPSFLGYSRTPRAADNPLRSVDVSQGLRELRTQASSIACKASEDRHGFSTSSALHAQRTNNHTAQKVFSLSEARTAAPTRKHAACSSQVGAIMVLGWPLCLDQRGCCIHSKQQQSAPSYPTCW